MIAVRQLHVQAGTFQLAGIDFTIPPNHYAVLMGRTGSGKTTLIEAICGLRPVLDGAILLHDQDVTTLPPARRQIGFVPQEGALFHHLTVRQQIAFPLVVRNAPPTDIARRVDEVAAQLGIAHLLDRRTTGLSGGEAQRVALGRALAFRPRVLCLDEPLSALDQDTRAEMQAVLRSLRHTLPVTVLHITHDPSEAVELADVILRLDNGRISPTPVPAP